MNLFWINVRKMSLDKEVPSFLANCSLNLEIHQPVQQLPKSPNIDYFNTKYRKWFLVLKQHLESECKCFERKLYASISLFNCLFSFSVKIAYALFCLTSSVILHLGDWRGYSARFLATFLVF